LRPFYKPNLFIILQAKTYLPALCLLLPSFISAQTFSGTVKDQTGAPVAQATVYVEELQQGTSTDADGEFRLRLPEGKYTCVFRCVGYTSVTQQITVPKNGLAMPIEMPIAPYAIGAVVISKNREDPAYGIMRQVIGMAPYYSNQVEYYKADVYIKGSAKIEKISKVVQMLGGKDFRDGLKLFKDKAVLLESLNEITFRAPKTFNHKVISTNSSLPMEFKGLNTMNFVQVNVYQTNIVDRDAFRNYKFSYEGVSEDNGLLINKIKVTPRIKNPMLFTGYIYIIDGTWHVYSADLHGSAPFGKYRLVGNCYQIRPDVYLPAAINVEGDVDFLGNKFTMSYQLALKYTEVTLNKTLVNPLKRNATATPAPAVLPQKSLPPPPKASTSSVALSKSQKKAAEQAQKDSVKRAVEQAERMEKINILLAKEDFNDRDMNRLAKLMQKNNEASQDASLDLSNQYKVEVDTNSRKMDAAAWDTLRPVELKPEEVRSFKFADTLRMMMNDSIPDDSTRRSRFGTTLGKFFGATIRLNDGKTLAHAQILDINSITFNAVDGFRYGINADIRHTTDSERQLRLRGKAAWAFSRQTVLWNLVGQFRYNPERRANLSFRTGITNHDYNYHRTVDEFVYTAATLFTHRNYTRLYEQFQVQVRNEIDIANGLVLIGHIEFVDRWKLQNHTNFAFFYPHREYAPNVPYNELIADDSPLYRTTDAEVTLVYTPEYYYRMQGKRKEMVRSKYPTFTLSYRKAVPNIAGSTSDFDMLRFQVRQKIPTGLMRNFSYNVEVAGFLNNRKVDLTNFYHFNIPGFAILYPEDGNPYSRYYKFATNQWGFNADAAYVSPLILLKYLPYFSTTYCRENIKWHVNYSPHGGFYNELHYSISEILLFIEIGAFVGFEDARFSVFGIDIRLRL
jgi:hypothetical protein